MILKGYTDIWKSRSENISVKSLLEVTLVTLPNWEYGSAQT